jgi:hypothetical protein
VQKWILAELRSLGSGARLATSDIAKRIAKASQRKFHPNSVYHALQLLVRRGDIDAVRSGHEKTYRLSGATRAIRNRVPRAVPAEATAPTPPGSTLGPPTATLPHKLALGEILVLSVTERAVLTATNLHGRLVIERHPLPA